MSEPTQPGPEPAPAPEPIAPAPEPSPPSPPASDAPITAREAAELIAGKPPATQSAPDGADAAPERPSGETDGSSDPETPPPIDAPRSWTKADKEAFALLPRDTQERVLALDRTRELELRRGQFEAAEQRKAAEALAQQAEQAQAQARAAYEQSLPQQALLLDAQYREEFGTPSWAELKEWQRTDPTRYQAWDVAYKQLKAASEELQAQQAQQYQQQYQQQQQFMQNAEAWKNEEAAKFAEKAPEWKDPKTYQSKVAEVLDYMEEIGYPRQEIEGFATNFVPIQIHDHRFQLIVRDALRYREAVKATKQPARNAVPPVQRPGSAPAKGEAQEARFKDLNRQLDRTGSIRDAARLISALNGGRSS